MNLIQASIHRPIAVISAVILTSLFGWLALTLIPVQLAPDVNQPIIQIETNWFGAAPVEVEREIVNEQEDALKGLQGLQQMESTASNGRAQVTLEFAVDQDMDKALLLVSNRLDRVGSYPDEADEPSLDTAGSEDSPIGWFIIKTADGNAEPVQNYGQFIEDVVRDRIERVDGVGRVNVYGAVEPEMRVVVDPNRMALYGLTVPDVVSVLRSNNAAISGGFVDEGKRRYTVRTEGDFNSLEAVESVLVRSAQDTASGRVARVTIGDIATVSYGFKEATAVIRQNGERAVAFNAVRETGANVIETMAGIQAALTELREGPLRREGLTLEQVYDETIYIEDSIDLVIQNLIFGAALAALVLLLFLRSARATLIITIAIPVSVVGSFVAMAALGRSINVISLAGLAFAVGMVVDAAIVVLENIYRMRQQGASAKTAAYRGAGLVWSAILVSALTTVMVFIPILVMDLEIGQLFRDIAVAISVAVILSLLVAITVIPALSARLLGGIDPNKPVISLPGVDHFGRAFSRLCVGYAAIVWRQKWLALLVVVGLTVTAVTLSLRFLPKLEYLPEGNRNLIFGVMLPPPGYNLETSTSIAEIVEGGVSGLWATQEEIEAFDAGETVVRGSETGPDGEPADPPLIRHFFFVSTGATSFFGAAALDPARARDLIGPMQGLMFAEPGTFGFVNQPSLFGRGIGGGRTIALDISGPDLEQTLQVAQRAAGKVAQVLPRSEGHQLRPKPGLELGAPEVRIYPDRLRLADAGITAVDLGLSVDAFNDGLRVDEITVEGRQIDLMLAGPDFGLTSTQAIGQLPVVTRQGTILTVAEVARVDDKATGPIEILHKERRRTVTLEIQPSPALALEEAMEILDAAVIQALEEEGVPPGVTMRLSGTADKLTETWQRLTGDLLLALIIVYLVMAVLFESFWYPILIVFAVPLAGAGAIGALALLNEFIAQPLDMLTMLGFVILIGIVVNNAILLVDQTLYHLREEGMTRRDAMLEATNNRIRPIFMSSLTSIIGMAPLVVMPGAGSELYRGLGTVVLGGLSLSAVLTLLVIPALLSLTLPILERDPAVAKPRNDGGTGSPPSPDGVSLGKSTAPPPSPTLAAE